MLEILHDFTQQEFSRGGVRHFGAGEFLAVVTR